MVGGSVVSGSNDYLPFRWTSGTGMVSLGTLPGGTATGGNRGYGVTPDGNTIVGTTSSTLSLAQVTIGEAFRWTSGGGMVALGTLNGGLHRSEALNVTADGGTIVGYANDGLTGSNSAYVWTSGTGMKILWQLLLDEAIKPAATGWTVLQKASAISSDGRYITGYGTRSGNTEAFIVDLGPAEPVPEASTWAAAGFLGLVGGLTVWQR